MLMRKFRSLLFRHGEIQHQIEAEQSRPNPDTMRLLKLKRLRLAIKDQLAKIGRAIARRDETSLAPVVAQRRGQHTQTGR